MEVVYKLTDQEMQTHGKTQWRLGAWREVRAEGPLCTPGWLHAYAHPYLAVLHNPIHANVANPRLFRAEAEGAIKRDGQMKLGAQKMRIIEEITVPVITSEQRIRYAIFVAAAVYHDAAWTAWAAEAATAARAARAAEAVAAAGDIDLVDCAVRAVEGYRHGAV